MLAAMLAALLSAAADPPAPALPGATPAVAPEKKPRKRSGKPPMAGVLNVNRATEAELRLLPGIGKKRAEQIVERRGKKPFASLDELSRMKGMRNLVHNLPANLPVDAGTPLHPLRPSPPTPPN